MDAAVTPPVPAEVDVDGQSVCWFLDGVVCLSEVGRCRAAGEDRCTYELTW